MKTPILVFLLAIFFAPISWANDYKALFQKDLKNGSIEMGCKVVVKLALNGSPSACFIPEPTVSKVACAVATIYKFSGKAGEQIIENAAIKGCRIGVASTTSAIEYTLEFGKKQAKEIKETWEWLNLQEGVEWLQYQLTL